MEPDKAHLSLSRRQFISAAAATTAGLVLSCRISVADAGTQSSAGETILSIWLRISASGGITISLPQSEIGQGISTGLPQVLASELGAKWEDIAVEFAYGEPEFINPIIYGEQITGGSLSMPGFYPIFRKAGAAARELLNSAAAIKSGLSPDSFDTTNSRVVHRSGNPSYSFSELVEIATGLEPPADPKLRSNASLSYVGKAVKRLDTADKVAGKAVFGVDVTLPDMVYAAVKHAPVFGSEVLNFDTGSIEHLDGILDVFKVSGGLLIVAERWWTAKTACDEIEVEFTPNPLDTLSTADVYKQIEEQLQNGNVRVAEEVGNVDALIENGRILEAQYQVPYLAHTTMEPMNCTALVTEEGAEIWVPTQAQTSSVNAVAEALSIDVSKVTINTTLSGGGFGRRGGTSFIVQAVHASKRLSRPVKVIWTREQDILRDQFRPAMISRMRGQINADGQLVTLSARNCGPGAWAYLRPELAPDGLDPLVVEGLTDTHYKIPNKRVECVLADPVVAVGFWRSVGYSHNIFFYESFIDEAAQLAGKDPIEFRKALVGDNALARSVMDQAADLSDWENKRKAGSHLGFAFFQSARWQSPVAMVAEVKIVDGIVTVPIISVVMDIGTAINPNLVLQQLEGATIFGLTATLYGDTTFSNGTVTESNFHNYEMLTLKDSPRIKTKLLQSGGFVGSAGELAVPCVAPAVANAIFAATGFRCRSLPVSITS